MQHESAVRVDDPFGKTRRAGREAHRSAVVFVNRGIAEIIAGNSNQLFVIQEAFGHGIKTIGNNDDALEGDIFTKLFVDREEHIVDEEKAVAGMFGNAGYLVRM